MLIFDNVYADKLKARGLKDTDYNQQNELLKDVLLGKEKNA